MVAKSLASEARKSAPAQGSRSRSKPVVIGALSVSERADSAVAARDYGGKVAPRRVNDTTTAFDREHREAFVRVHARFARRYRRAYGRVYPRSVHTDWSALRTLIREVGREWAEVAVDRVFDEPLMVEAGVDCVQLVATWWPQMVKPRNARSGSRLTREQQATARAVIREHAALVGGGA